MLFPNVYGQRCVLIGGMPHPGFEEGYWNNSVRCHQAAFSLTTLPFCLASCSSNCPLPRVLIAVCAAYGGDLRVAVRM